MPAFAAARTHLPAPADSIRLLLPRPGIELSAGDELVLQWEPGPAFAQLGEVEEWEAFLSLDGGGRFPFRLTPHLDLARRRVTVRLPEIASDDARLLLRVGDEVREHELLWPGRFTIRPGPPGMARHRGLGFVAGEPARAGGSPTWAWVEGRRDGSGWREVEAVPGSARLGRASPVLSGGRVPREALAAPPGPRLPAPAADNGSRQLRVTDGKATGAPAAEPAALARGAGVRRLISRWNE